VPRRRRGRLPLPGQSPSTVDELYDSLSACPLRPLRAAGRCRSPSSPRTWTCCRTGPRMDCVLTRMSPGASAASSDPHRVQTCWRCSCATSPVPRPRPSLSFDLGGLRLRPDVHSLDVYGGPAPQTDRRRAAGLLHTPCAVSGTYCERTARHDQRGGAVRAGGLRDNCPYRARRSSGSPCLGRFRAPLRRRGVGAVVGAARPLTSWCPITLRPVRRDLSPAVARKLRAGQCPGGPSPAQLEPCNLEATASATTARSTNVTGAQAHSFVQELG